MHTITLCPYLLKPLAEIASSNEHIIPFALGGPDKFTVKADADENNKLGLTVDAGLINDALSKGLATKFGLVTRSGPATFRALGQADLGSQVIPVNVSIERDIASVLSAKPAMKIGEEYLLSGSDVQIRKKINEIFASGARKGITYTFGEIRTAPAVVNFRIAHNILKKTCGLLKIAYLALVYTFGDDFIKSEAACKFRDGYNASNLEALEHTALINNFILDSCVNLDDNGLHEVIAVRGHGVYCAFVSLFHVKAFTRQFAFACEGLDKNSNFEGKVYTIEPRERCLLSEIKVPAGDSRIQLAMV